MLSSLCRPVILHRKGFSKCVLPAMPNERQTRSLTKALVKKLETNQRAMARKMLNVKLKDRIRHTIIRQRTRVTDIVQIAINAKRKWAEHIVRMKDNRWTIGSKEGQIKGLSTVGRPKRRWRDDIVGQQEAVWTRIVKDRESWRTQVESHFLQWTDTAWNRTE